MLTIGLTGGIGSGKSTIAKIFEVLEIPVFYADKEAKALLNTDEKLQEKIKDAFGEKVYDEKGELNRKALAKLVFNDQEALSTLNKLVHPVVRQEFQDWVKSQSNENPYLIQEAALLFETGANEGFDYMISVTAPEETRINRIMERDQMSRKDVLSRMENQLSQEEKDMKSDFVINNDGKQLVIPEVVRIHNVLTGETKEKAEEKIN